MKKTALIIICFVVGAIAGCGQNFEWFPSSSGGGGTTPVPPPPGQTVTDVQADTVTTFNPYTVTFNSVTSSSVTTSISVSGDISSMYSVNGGAPTNVAGTVKGNDVITVQNTSSNYGSNQTISTLLNVGGASANYISTTGSLVFVTKKGVAANTDNYPSDAVSIPAQLPGSFVFPATVKFDATKTTATNSTIWIGGQRISENAQVHAGDSLQLKHTTASTSGAIAVTALILTPTSGTPYTVTYKTVTQ